MSKRNKKISADISEEAFELLAGLVIKHERSKGWLLDKMIKTYCNEPEAKKEKPKQNRVRYPSNFDEQFELLWATKGKKGAKSKARDKYKRMLANESDETCESLTILLINDIQSNMSELGMEELHLTTYLNQERWERD
jgi:hypothetical protein